MKYLTILLTIFALKTCDSSEQLINKSKMQDMTLSGVFTVTTLEKKSSTNNLTLEFDALTKKVSGFSGCNRYFGAYTINKDSISIGPLASTRKYCIGEANAIELKFQTALSKVNNFIIENNEISLLNDTEVLINLIEEVKKKENCKLGKAVQVALNQVVGAYAIAVFDQNKPNEIVVAKLGSPLAIGVGEDEFFIASDASPFIEFTNNAIYLEDEEMAVIRLGREIRVRKIKNDKRIKPFVQELKLNIEQIEKGNTANDYGTYKGSMSNHDKVYDNIIRALNGDENKATEVQ